MADFIRPYAPWTATSEGCRVQLLATCVTMLDGRTSPRTDADLDWSQAGMTKVESLPRNQFLGRSPQLYQSFDGKKLKDQLLIPKEVTENVLISKHLNLKGGNLTGITKSTWYVLEQI
jgi:hypothetical protein